MAKTKTAKTVRARVAVVYNDKGEYQAGGYKKWDQAPYQDDVLIGDAYDGAPDRRSRYPFACIVDVELPIPKPIVGKVTKVKAVKP